jgi:hypothetical protein
VHVHLVTDLFRHEIENASGGNCLRAGQVPDLPDGALIGAERGEACCDVGHVAVAVEQVGVAEEVRTPAGEGIGEDLLAESGFGDSGAEEVRGPPDGDADLTGVRGCHELVGHRGASATFRVVAASGRSSVIALPPIGP